MKILIYILLLASVAFTSCTKESFEPIEPVEEAAVIEEGILIYGEWKLVSGKMYIENMETGEKTVYDHFSPTKTTSSLRYGGAQLEFETIEQNVTTWEFCAPPNWTGYGEFILDGDTINPYGLYVLDANWSVVEHPTATAATMQLGGSARPLLATVTDYDSNQVAFVVQEAYESIGGYNCNYYSELIFKKQ
jgi:hypothetical protein